LFFFKKIKEIAAPVKINIASKIAIESKELLLKKKKL